MSLSEAICSHHRREVEWRTPRDLPTARSVCRDTFVLMQEDCRTPSLPPPSTTDGLRTSSAPRSILAGSEMGCGIEGSMGFVCAINRIFIDRAVAEQRTVRA